VAGYTANLASFLIVGRQAIICKDLATCINEGDKFCVRRGVAAAEIVKSKFTELDNQGRIISAPNSPSWYSVLQEGTCNHVFDTLDLVKMNMANKMYNNGCRLARVGQDVVASVGAGWVTRPDFGGATSKCTNVFNSCLAYHFMQLQLDGTMDRLVAEYMARQMLDPCVSAGDYDDDSDKLGVENMMGLFVTHGIACRVVLLLCVLARVTSRFRNPVNAPANISSFKTPVDIRQLTSSGQS